MRSTVPTPNKDTSNIGRSSRFPIDCMRLFCLPYPIHALPFMATFCLLGWSSFSRCFLLYPTPPSHTRLFSSISSSNTSRPSLYIPYFHIFPLQYVRSTLFRFITTAHMYLLFLLLPTTGMPPSSFSCVKIPPTNLQFQCFRAVCWALGIRFDSYLPYISERSPPSTFFVNASLGKGVGASSKKTQRKTFLHHSCVSV